MIVAVMAKVLLNNFQKLQPELGASSKVSTSFKSLINLSNAIFHSSTDSGAKTVTPLHTMNMIKSCYGPPLKYMHVSGIFT
ncbi:hypothetical protein GmHk_02G005936 [Glycine max]|nr:hypothetical protein GmHk_02G005936 [Glycine max]